MNKENEIHLSAKTLYIKYPAIENSYQRKLIEKAIETYPELPKCHYILTEKIHGSNFALICTPAGEMHLAKRSQLLAPDDPHYGLRVVLNKHPELDILRTEAQRKEITLHLYGEVFGKGIQKGVDYGEEKQIAFFDMRINNRMLSPIEFYVVMNLLGLRHLCVPTIGLYSFEDALAYDVETLRSQIVDKEGNIAEGIVIKPLGQVYYLPSGQTFFLKKKSEKFQEKIKLSKATVPADDEIVRWHVKFLEYITEERVQGIFSKYGAITQKEQIGDYIRFTIIDAQNDFFKDYPDLELQPNELKKVCNVGNVIVKILKKELGVQNDRGRND